MLKYFSILTEHSSFTYTESTSQGCGLRTRVCPLFGGQGLEDRVPPQNVITHTTSRMKHVQSKLEHTENGKLFLLISEQVQLLKQTQI